MCNTPLFGLLGLQPEEAVSIMGIMIPIIAIVMGIGMGGWTVYLNYRKRREMFTLYHQERMAAIEKGIDLPPLPDAFFTEDGRPHRPRSPHSKLLTGLILLFGGAATLCAMYFTNQGTNALWSLIVVAVGAAFLIFYFAVDKKRAELIDAKQEAELISGKTPPKN